MRHRWFLVPILACATVFSIASTHPGHSPVAYTTEFGLDAEHSLSPDGANGYMSLKPGTFHRYVGEDDNLPVVIEVTVLDATQPVAFRAHGQSITVLTRIVEEREWIDGELTQVSLNYYASCSTTGNIYYLGEDVDHYQDGVVVSHEGSWIAGKRGARPGLRMPGFFLLGARYQQDIAPHVSMDQAEHMGMGAVIETPAGVFRNCVTVLETTPLEPDEETLKIYAPGVGLVIDGSLELVEYHN